MRARVVWSLPVVILCGALFSASVSPDRIAPRTPSAPAAPDTGWLARAEQQIAEREYHASDNGSGLQAPNRAHDLRTYFEKSGIRVHDRTAGGSPELLSLSLARVGRGATLAAVAPGEEVVVHENRIEIRRPGLVEWYVNSPAGLEEGFTLAERPSGDGSLVMEVAVADARASLRGDAIEFETNTQRKLRYGALQVADAAGHAVQARLEIPDAQRLRIVVDDAGATYPLAIDPLLTETADTQLESNQANANLGYSVASAGDVNGDGYADVIVGADAYDAGQTDEGAAFVFLGSASGIASGNPATSATVLQSNQTSAFFGSSVAGAGDVNGDGYADVIVGASFYSAGQTGEGAAFVFLGSASGIASGSPATASAQLESNQMSASFGYSVASAGDVNGDGYADVIVGAPGYDAGQTDEGAAFVFLGSASGIASGNPATAATQLESNQASAFFGSSVAGAGDVNGDGYADVIVGASHYDNGQLDEGAAFVFLGSASGIASGNPATAATQLESNQASAFLGQSVAGAGDVNGDGYADVIVGAYRFDAGETDEGAAFVFLGSASGVASGNPSTAAAELQSNQANAQMGYSVAGAGDVNGDGYADVIVGAPTFDAGETDEGAAFVFLGSASGIASGNPTTAAAELQSNQAGAQLGGSVAGAGDVNGDGYADVIAGAQFYSAGQTGEGAAFVYLGGASGIVDGNPTTASAQLESNQAGAQLGWSVAGAGDVNGDGYADVIVGAQYYDAGETDEGAAFVFLGSASGIANGNPATASAVLQSNQANSGFGSSVAGAGDVNGDGYADVIVGAPAYDAGETDEGAAFVFLGSASGIASGNPATASAVLESNQESAAFGSSVAGAGDVNGDGYADVIVGAQYYDSFEGAAFVFMGSPPGIASGNPSTAATRLVSSQTGAALGASVAGAGDVNGDGYADVIVGAVYYDSGQTDEGAAFVFLGSPSGIASGDPTTAAAQLESDQAGARFGASVAGAGDVNGDGYADVIVGAFLYDAGETDEGAAFVFLGSASGIASGNPATAAAQLESNQAGAEMGWSVAGAGDVNGDGYADVIVGAPTYDAGQTDEGAAFVFLGSASGIASGNPVTASAQLESNAVAGRLGSGVAGAGDVNGDGYADVIVGSPYFAAGQAQEGAAFVYLGNAKGRPVLARQRRGDGSGTPVQPWGLAYSTSGFAAELRATHPAGRGRVKAEFQACPPGVAFGNASCTSETTPTWVTVDGTAPEVLISQTFSGLANHTLYRWRARVLLANATGTIPAKPEHGPWRRLGAQSVEADVRVVPEPGMLLSLGSGAALLAALARRRRPSPRAATGSS
ncbi:MAG TPA: integrin alpha [Myxococcota bacterium]|nr:integrin alpha [Myxococcota bacterium]